MVVFDIERINKISPYKVEATKKAASLVFHTDYDLTYEIRFVEDFILQCEQGYQINVTKADSKPSPNDEKVRKTITEIVMEFFYSNNYALVYICDTGDNKQKARHRLFHSWVNNSQYKELFEIREAQIKDEEGVENYTTLIIDKKHPHLKEVLQEFEATIDLFSNKPE